LEVVNIDNELVFHKTALIRSRNDVEEN